MFTRKCLNLFFLTPKTCFPRHFSQEYTPKALRSLKGKSTRNTVQYYLDFFRVRAVAGNGGDGCISFLSAWCKEHAGPDGGDGGNGGHVIFQASHTVKSLNHCKSVIQAKHGERGFNKDCSGKNADHVIVPVPLGTIIKDASGKVVGDLSSEGVMFVAARGGAGGRGNRFFLTDTEQAPDIAELGAQGETNVYSLEVRSMAHIGLIGFPNAGKSTLLRALTRARPNVAPYPFTTLRPHIGMIPYDDYEQVAIADLPGLIPGSHKNHGLGIQFLQHVERCRGLIYLLDGTNEPLQQLESLTYELNQYSNNLSHRPNCVVVNKIDLKEGRVGFEEVKNGISEVLNMGETVVESRVNIESGVNKSDIGLNKSDVGLNKSDVGLNQRNIGLNEKNNEGSETIHGVNNNNNGVSIDNQSSKIEISSDKENIGNAVKVLGISAKTGMNLSELLRVVRNMYDSGDNR